jgi:hypothetical protein
MATSGLRGASEGAHGRGLAYDMEIFKGDSKIENRGADTTGLYGEFAMRVYRQMLHKYPELGPYLNWGRWFETKRGSGQADIMHFDFWGAQRFRSGLAEKFKQFYESNSRTLDAIDQDTAKMAKHKGTAEVKGNIDVNVKVGGTTDLGTIPDKGSPYDRDHKKHEDRQMEGVGD